MRFRVVLWVLVVVLVGAVPAGAHGPMAWDGSSPFECELQRVGTGVDFPDPDADPFCVEYDKTHQDLSGLGVVDFLAKEPARVAVALDKCFYYQRDEWLGSVLEGGELETYHWRGSYYFDKARGAGGAYVERVRVAGQAGDPSWVGHIPAPYDQFFHPTGGGGQVIFDHPADPRCAR